MNYETFESGIAAIYATFSRKAPAQNILKAIYKRIEHLPPDFMDYALRHIEDLEEMPKNIGQYLIRNLWPEYLERHPELKSRWDKSCCPLCDPNIPGWRKVYQPEVTGWGEETYKPVLVRCTCGTAPNPNQEKVYQDYELEQLGFKLECLFHWSKDNLPECLRSLQPSK